MLNLHTCITCILIWLWVFISTNTYAYKHTGIDFNKKWDISWFSHIMIVVGLTIPILNVIFFGIIIYGYFTVIINKEHGRYRFYAPWKIRNDKW